MKRSAPLKRTPMKRTSSLRMTGPAKAEVKPRKCAVKGCRKPFLSGRSFVSWCSPECGAVIAEQKLQKARAAEERKQAAEHREKLADSKPLQHWLKLTERVVNHYILTRDAAYGCISCGARTTVQWEAGHYLSVGSHPELRYHPGNINKQCHHCNHNKSGNQAAYRIGLVERHGVALVEELEGPHPTAKYTRDGLAAIRRHFAAETRKLKKAMP